MQLGNHHCSQRDICDLVVHPFPNFKDFGERPGENISPQYEPILASYILATSERVFYIAMLFVVPVINTLITSSCQMKLTDIGIYIKTMASEAIYRKALVLTSTAKGETSTGQLVNIMSSDTNMVLRFSVSRPYPRSCISSLRFSTRRFPSRSLFFSAFSSSPSRSARSRGSPSPST